MTCVQRPVVTALLAFLGTATACGSDSRGEVDAAPSPPSDRAPAPTTDSAPPPTDSDPGLDAGAGGRCVTYPGCGGNLVGTWRVLDYCHDYEDGESFKECEWMVRGYVTATGTMTFGADLIFSTDPPTTLLSTPAWTTLAIRPLSFLS